MKGHPGERVLGRYEVRFQIGSGGFGRVFLARQIALGRDVAIKVAGKAQSSDPEVRERFRREAVLVASINHPSVVTYHDFGEDADGELILVMELLHGISLRELMDKGKVLPLATVVEFAAQAAAGLAEAHARGIVHRDIKPSNLFLVSPGTREERVKVIDFGILWVDPKIRPGVPRLTDADMVIGTPDYLPPEMLMGRRPDGRSDQYSLALVVYEMLAGRKAFRESAGDGALVARITGRPDDLSFASTGREVPPAMTRVLHTALSPDPDDRHPSMAAFREALLLAAGVAERRPHEERTLLAEPALEPTRTNVTALHTARARPGGRRLWIAALAAAAVCTAGGIAVSLTGSDPGSGLQPAEQPAIMTAPKAESVPETLARREPDEPLLLPRAGMTEVRAEAVHQGSAREIVTARPVVRREESGEYATLTLNADPWAEVIVDGTGRGRTPRRIDLPPGRHVVTFLHPSLGTRTVPVTLRPGERAVRTADFRSSRP